MSNSSPLEMVNAILDLEDGLTDWEIDFTTNMWTLLKKNEILTARQLAKLTDIHEKKVIDRA